MKKSIAILTALMLAVLCCVTAQAETEKVICFQDIPWESDVETVTQALLDAGWINEDGVERMESIEEHAERTRMGIFRGGSRIPQFVTEDGHIIADDDDGSQNAVSGRLMSDMVTKEWMGIEVHNIELIFVLEGTTEKLLTVTVSLMVNREDRRPELEEIYGKPDDVNEEYDKAAYWEGQEGTVLYYGGTEVIYSLKDAKERADAAVFEMIETPTPVPTPEPTPLPDLGETDIMSFVKKGELNFLDIPWDSDVTTAADRMAALGFITQETRNAWQGMRTEFPSALRKKWDFWSTIYPAGDTWEAYFLWAGGAEFTQTCFGYPVGSATVNFKKDGDNTKLRCVRLQCYDVIDAKTVVRVAKAQLEEVLGKAAEYYGSWYWEGENDTVIYLSGLENSFSVDFGISTEE